MVPFLALAVAGIFTGKHLGSFLRAVVVVIAFAAVEEPLLVAVEVLVVEVASQFLHAGLQQVEVPSF